MSDSSDDEVFQRVKSQNNKSFSKEDEETLKILKAEDKNEIKDESDETIEPKSFAELGVTEVLCQTVERLGWKAPSKIQEATLPFALAGRDLIGLAETGSGKTGAFAIPILQALLETPQKMFAVVLTPTRELAFQIAEQFQALGTSIGLCVAVIVGGIDMATQAMALAKRPHVIVATPGRLVDHLENTKGFNLKAIKFLVMDEADRILNMDFEVEVNKILRVIPKERRTYLFSATMTKKVAKLERASLRNPERIEISTRYQTVEKLKQHYIFIPNKYKEAYLVYILNEIASNTAIVFCSTCAGAMKIALMLRQLGFGAVPLHGQMNQGKRLAALNKFKAKQRSILVCTDVASRGLDIPHVDYVLNFDVPTQSKDYVHRVGRTARAGRSGVSITFVTQYDVEIYQRIEHLIGKKLELYKTNEVDVMKLVERVAEANSSARVEMKELEESKKNKKKRKKGDLSDNDDDEEGGYRKKVKVKNMKAAK
ncbi:Probable ATP-dependent RNA helicase DDX47 [Strongyloides ratti]|uniref:RNA helicase n=1 Tax=Strongyloides ratti TaxID=34506 RepID=A0A090L4A3_STRRB|nr:Probable ATP-dependent RNA helicase DDX47 [Strongyloides ratti]CEF62294.1 Probable ATP-dependent RNA helicase DDX47 [Strongyloides ratti]